MAPLWVPKVTMMGFLGPTVGHLYISEVNGVRKLKYDAEVAM